MWQKIIGHNRQKEQLQAAIGSGNIPHAYLMSGIDGIGKRQTTYAAAAALLCKNLGENASPCEKCSACLKFLSRNHPDFIEVTPESNQITIDSIRSIKDTIRFPPLEAERRVIVIDHVELMNVNTQNAALKILEEPPAGNHFFLVTPTPMKLLPTIVSRCRTLQFSPLKQSMIENYLITHHNFPADQAKGAAEAGEGSIGRTLRITPDIIDSVYADLLKALQTTSCSDIIDISANWASMKEETETILYLVHHCFHASLISCVESKSEKSISKDIHEILSLIRLKNRPYQLMEKCNLINRFHSHTTKTYNKQLMFEQLLFSLRN